MRMTGCRTQTGLHAVVIGGSVAGTLAVHVLARHVDRVTLVERDVLPDEPTFRRGVPQAYQNHATSAGGRLILDRLLPGFVAALLADGATLFDPFTGRASPPGHRGPSHRVLALQVSRPRLEWRLRRRVLENPRITVLSGTAVTGLVCERGRVTGVTMRNAVAMRPDSDGTLPADLVVDASGRGSPVPQWLGALGYPQVPLTTLDSGAGDASRHYELPQDWPPDLISSGSPPAPDRPTRYARIHRLEGDRLIVQLIGLLRDFPGSAESDFHEVVSTLPAQVVSDVVGNATPLTPIRVNRSTTNLRRHYERLRPAPEGLIVVGDAFCALNPLYAQGITLAAIAAELLDKQLARISCQARGFARAYHRRLARAIREPCLHTMVLDRSTMSDLGGIPQSGLYRLLGGVSQRIGHLSATDPAIRMKAVETGALIRSGAWVFRPRILLKLALASSPHQVRRTSLTGRRVRHQQMTEG